MTFFKSDDIFFETQATSIAYIFRKHMFIKLQLLMILSITQFIQRFTI